MPTYQRGDRFRDRDGRLLELLQRVDPRGDIPPFWRVRTIVEVTGVDVQARQPIVDEKPGQESTVREDRLAGDYRPEPTT